MPDTCTYHIRVAGRVDGNEINKLSPQQVTIITDLPPLESQPSTLFAAVTDQAGVIGLLRHLHGSGYVFLSINRVD